MDRWFAARDRTGEWRPARRALPLAVLVVLLLGALFVTLARQVEHELDRLSTSRTDNAYWTLTQLEVEFLELNSALAQAATGPEAALHPLRQRYDILFSRLVTLDESPFYQMALIEAGSLDRAVMVARSLRDMAPLFDGPDAALRAAVPAIRATLERLRPDIRTLAVEGNLLLARTSATARAQLASALFRLAGVTLALLAVLAALAVGFFRVSLIARQRARHLRRTSTRLGAIIGTAPDGLIVTDGQGRIEQANPAACALLGRSASDLAGQPIGALLTRRADGRPLDLPAPGQGPARIEVMARREDGTAFPGDVAMTRADTDGAAIAVLFLRDITDRVAAEDMLRRSRDQAMAGERAKAHFIAVMSHEMRTPLNAILGLSDLLAETPLPAEAQAQVALLQRSGQVLLQHVNDVLDIARLEARGPAAAAQTFDLASLLGDLVASLTPEAELRGNTLRLEITPQDAGQFRGDPPRLRQVLANLLTNAVKYTRAGHVTLQVTVPPGPHPMVEFQVLDTGIGIAGAQMDAIFADFVRLETPGLREDGTGLGLGIVRRLVEAMAGELGVESEPGEGSLFWVRLPLARVTAPVPADPAPPPAMGAAPDSDQAPNLAPNLAPRLAPRDVLMAEDHPVNRLVLRRLLERDGHRVVEVADGAAAVAAAAAARFDVILMDIGLPGMDGLAATAAIRAGSGAGSGSGASARARIVAVTAHAFPEDRARFLAAGFDAVIVKPVSGAALRQTLAGPDLPASTQHDTPLQDLIGREAAQRALRGLQADARSLAADLRAGRATPDAVHRLAGLAGTCGAADLAAQLAGAERALRAGLDWDDAPLLRVLDTAAA